MTVIGYVIVEYGYGTKTVESVIYDTEGEAREALHAWGALLEQQGIKYNPCVLAVLTDVDD